MRRKAESRRDTDRQRRSSGETRKAAEPLTGDLRDRMKKKKAAPTTTTTKSQSRRLVPMVEEDMEMDTVRE